MIFHSEKTTAFNSLTFLQNHSLISVCSHILCEVLSFTGVCSLKRVEFNTST